MSLKNLPLYIKFIFLFYYITLSQQTSMNFLKIPTTARHSSIGGYCAVSDDVGGIFSNPAGLVRCDSSQFGVSHNEHFQDSKYGFLGVIFPKKTYVISLGLSILHIDNIEARTYKDLDLEYTNIHQTTSPEYYYSAYSLQTGVGFSKRFLDRFLFGTTFKFLQESISNVNGYSFATDLGFQFFIDKKKNLNIALSINNLGLPVRYEKEKYSLPIQVVFGSSYLFKNLNLVYEVALPVFDKEDFYMSIGSESLILDYLCLRFGYRYKPHNWQLNEQVSGLTGGVGFNFFGTKLDYSLVSYGILGVLHRFSLILELDKIGKFYELFRKKIFKAQPSVLEKSSCAKEVKETSKTTKTPKSEITTSNKKILKEEISSFVNVKLLSIDSQNRIFVYEIKLSSETTINEYLSLNNLTAKASTRKQLQSQQIFKIFISTDVPFDSKEYSYCKVFDFSDLSNLGVTSCSIEFISYIDRVNFYLLDKENNALPISNLTKRKKDNVYYYNLQLSVLNKILVKINK